MYEVSLTGTGAKKELPTMLVHWACNITECRARQYYDTNAFTIGRFHETLFQFRLMLATSAAMLISAMVRASAICKLIIGIACGSGHPLRNMASGSVGDVTQELQSGIYFGAVNSH